MTRDKGKKIERKTVRVRKSAGENELFVKWLLRALRARAAALAQEAPHDEG